MKRIGFVSSSRADYGKLKPLMSALHARPEYEVKVFVTGMHLRQKWGYTLNHLLKDGWDCYPHPCSLEMVTRTADVVRGCSMFLDDIAPDLVVIHGDKAEALGAATACSINNARIAHIEGGELSGTIDGNLRHAITKLAHVHFVTNETAANRVLRLAEQPDSVHVIGSPEVDLMLDKTSRPTLRAVAKKYPDIAPIIKSDYGIVMYHSVTTDRREAIRIAWILADAIGKSGKRWVVIQPNDDAGTEEITEALASLKAARDVCRVLPSMRFEHFLTLLENARCLVGNSSCGVRESPVYGTPSINLGTRQKSRTADQDSVLDLETPQDAQAIVQAINSVWTRKFKPSFPYGRGGSAERFVEVLDRGQVFEARIEKEFVH